MDRNLQNFESRIGAIERRHSRQQGRRSYVERNGLILPDLSRERRRGLPWRGALTAVLCVTLFKSFMIWHEGEAGYRERLAELREGDGGARAAAWILTDDPASLWLAERIGFVLGSVQR